jgi:hypothetical protein
VTSPIALLAALTTGEAPAPEGVAEDPVAFLAALVAAMQGHVTVPVPVAGTDPPAATAPEESGKDQGQGTGAEEGATPQAAFRGSDVLIISTVAITADGTVAPGPAEADPRASGASQKLECPAGAAAAARPAPGVGGLAVSDAAVSPVGLATAPTDAAAPEPSKGSAVRSAPADAAMAAGRPCQEQRDVGEAPKPSGRSERSRNTAASGDPSPPSQSVELGGSPAVVDLAAALAVARALDAVSGLRPEGPATVPAAPAATDRTQGGRTWRRGTAGQEQATDGGSAATAEWPTTAALAADAPTAIGAPAARGGDALVPPGDPAPAPARDAPTGTAAPAGSSDASAPVGTPRDAVAARALPAWAFVSTLRDLLGGARILEFQVTSGASGRRDGEGRTSRSASEAADSNAAPRDRVVSAAANAVTVQARPGQSELADAIGPRPTVATPIRRAATGAGQDGPTAVVAEPVADSGVTQPRTGERTLAPGLITAAAAAIPAIRPRELHASPDRNLPAVRQEVPTGNGTVSGADSTSRAEGRPERQETSDAPDRASDARPGPGADPVRGEGKLRNAEPGEARNLRDTTETKQQPAGLADRVAIRLADGEGRETRIRVTVIGDQVRATIQSSDPEAARHLERRMDELQAALVRQGYVDPKITVQGARAEPVTVGAGVAGGSGEAAVTHGSEPSNNDDRQGTGRRDQQRQQGGQDRPDQRPRDRDTRDRRKGRDA